MRKKLANTFALFLSQISQILGLPGGVHRFCKKSPVYSQLTRVTDGQRDKRESDLNSGVYYITLAEKLCCRMYA